MPRLGNAVHRSQGKRASRREKEALLSLEEQATRVCDTRVVPYLPQLRHSMAIQTRTQAYLENSLGANL